jgi:uncharacterized protein (TIGR03435 family)
LLVAVAITAVFFGATVSVRCQIPSLATSGATPQFDVAVVKPNRSSDPPTSRFPLGIGDAFVPGGIFAATNQPLIAYLRFAFKLGDLEGLRPWVSVQRFDIEGRAESTSSKDDMRLMMQGLLKERFGLRFHTEPHTATGLGLRVVRRTVLGPNLRRADPAKCASGRSDDKELIPCGRIGPSTPTAPGHDRISARSIPLSRFATFITNPATGIDRPVFDQTELAGLFDLDVEWTIDADSGFDHGKAEVGDLTFAQAMNDQLGLKVIRSKGTFEILRIDRIERLISD